MNRQQAIREWADQRAGLSRKLVDTQNRWRLLAGQYVGLPLSFRRDMSRGMWSERYTCAAILQHIAAFPNIVSDPATYASSLIETFDMLLSETETCLASRGWYGMLHEAASLIRRWENVSDNDLDPQRVASLLNQAESAVKTIELMLQSLINSSLSREAWPAPSARMMRAWNTMVDEIRWGKTLEEAAGSATWNTPFTEAPSARSGGRRQGFGGDDPFADRYQRSRPQSTTSSAQRTAQPTGPSIWQQYNDRWDSLPPKSNDFPYPSADFTLSSLTSRNITAVLSATSGQFDDTTAAKYNATDFFARNLLINTSIKTSTGLVYLHANQSPQVIEAARQHLKQEARRWHPDKINGRTGDSSMEVDDSIAKREEMKGVWEAVSGLRDACDAFFNGDS